MDNRSFISALAKATDRDSRAAGAMARLLAQTIAEIASENDSVALPGFGTFTPVLTPEHVVTDTETGRRRLEPPHRSIDFTPASRLKKIISAES